MASVKWQWPLDSSVAFGSNINIDPESQSREGGKPNPDASVHLPRILCLHGGGTNRRIFAAQCRVLRAHLATHFRLVFADAPFPSPPGPDVESVYAGWGPFRSWLPMFYQPDADRETVERIDANIAAALREDDAAGARGPVVALLGFSQGAKMAASLLFRRQRERELRKGTKATTDYRFAVLFAGRGPLISLASDPDPEANERGIENHIVQTKETLLLQLPTIHVHGLYDVGIEAHRELLHISCQKGSTRLVEWDGDHRMPIKTRDVAAVVAEILQLASSLGLR